MGITGLIPFLEKASSIVNIKELEGSTVAVDSYCWLHRGVFACAEKLIRGESTNVHIQYCMKYVDMLLRHKVNIIMVFDGKHLPAKAETERRRREARIESKKLAKEYLRSNDVEKARMHMRRAVDVTHEMALELIKACRSQGIDCIVAPYEADAQLAWLNKQCLADYIVTEDSDLTLFGAQKILFKLDLTGQALLVESTKFYLAMGCKPEKYTFDKFRRMCILSGCDYLDSLQGIGLKKACKFILTTEEEDMTRALKKIPHYLKMKQLEITNDYIESFLKAEATFRHMFIYNPLERRMERLHDLHEYQTDERYSCNAGTLLADTEQALQLALGNLNPFTLKQLDNWYPNCNWFQGKSKCKSIWQSPTDIQVVENPGENKQDKPKTTASLFEFKNIEYKNMAEMEIEEKRTEERSKLEESEIFCMYKNVSPKIKGKRKRRQSSTSSSEDEVNDQTSEINEKSSANAYNPFAKVNTSPKSIERTSVCANNSLLQLLSCKTNNENNFNQQTKKISVKSRFFADNIKQAAKKTFEARDLTSEMLKIEKEANVHMEKQRDLYNFSLQSPKNNIEQNISDDVCNQNNEVESMKYIKKTLTSEIESRNKIQETKTPEPEVLEEEIILLSDVEEGDYGEQSETLPTAQNFTTRLSHMPKTKNHSLTKSHILDKKLGNVGPQQSKLSMFGFQKKTLLKKL